MKKTLIILILFSLVALVSAHTGNDEFDHCHGFCPMMSGAYGFGGIILGWIFGISVIVVFMLLIVWLIKQIQKK